jgi:hypothetical protein
MRERWFADDRDLIKWAVLIQLAKSSALRTIVQIPYFRPENYRPRFHFLRDLCVSDEVWKFFKNLKSVERLGEPGIEIKVFLDEEFNSHDRSFFSQKITAYLEGCDRPLLLFLDPDTGLEPKTATVTHVTKKEVGHAWAGLKKDDWLVLYQHARRQKEWKTDVSHELRQICQGANVEVARSDDIGKDVALLCARKA